jgi:NADH-quinone oxidoreductase subunit F
MDLRLLPDAPTEAERRAVDAVLGPPPSWWEGAERRAGSDDHVAYGGANARARRHELLPALHALQDAVGWVSRGGLNYVCERLTVPPAEAYGLATFYHLLATEPQPPAMAYVCIDIVCRGRGAEALIARLEAEEAGGREGIGWKASPCLGRCDAAPAVFLHEAGSTANRRSVGGLGPDDVVELLGDSSPISPGPPPTPQLRAGEHLRLLRRVGTVDPYSLESYRQHGGYAALAWAVDCGPGQVVAEVESSRLLGRGGAAFPAGVKWRAVAEASSTPKYVIANADESEPGTFKDRVLLEHDPFALLEAMTIAGFSVGAESGYVYVRGEYPEAEAALENAIRLARSAGLLGDITMGETSFTFDVELRRGAGAYICGEETALFNSIEGYRGEPRQKPPFPTEAGLFGRPTLVNNVETLYNVLDIVLEGGEAFADVGTESSTGTKLFCLSGDIAIPGLYEFPFGITLGEIISAAGGVPGDPAAVLVGGAAGSFVAADRLDMQLTFEGAREAGLSLGSGVVMPFSTGADFADIVGRIAEFFRDESCGQCVPCRVGTVRQHEALDQLREGVDTIPILEDLARVLQDSSICGLGQLASGAVMSAIRLGLLDGGFR